MLKSNINTNQPTFLLKDIDPNILYKKYKEGYFNRDIPKKCKIKIVHPEVIQSTIFKPKEQNCVNHIKITLSGENDVEFFKSNGNKIILGGRCDYCKCDFETEKIGYPLIYENKQILTKDETYKNIHIFWIEGSFCSYECCLSYVKLINNNLVKDNLMMDAEVMLRFLYYLLYNNTTPLLEANDPKLLKSNGGSLSHEDWKNNNVQYVRTNNVIKIPAEVVYNTQLH